MFWFSIIWGIITSVKSAVQWWLVKWIAGRCRRATTKPMRSLVPKGSSRSMTCLCLTHSLTQTHSHNLLATTFSSSLYNSNNRNPLFQLFSVSNQFPLLSFYPRVSRCFSPKFWRFYLAFCFRVFSGLEFEHFPPTSGAPPHQLLLLLPLPKAWRISTLIPSLTLRSEMPRRSTRHSWVHLASALTSSWLFHSSPHSPFFLLFIC